MRKRVNLINDIAKCALSAILVLVCSLTVCCNNSALPPDVPKIEDDDGIIIGDYVSGKGTLVWRDEFNGASLDLTKWNYDQGSGAQYGSGGWGNDEKQYYRQGNVKVANGKLVIEAGYLGVGTYPYSSGKITTAGVRMPSEMGGEILPPKAFLGVTTGYVEARLKAPRGTGFWPAFWMLGADNNQYSGFPLLGWPLCGEIDIMEMRGGQETILHQTIHYGNVPFSWSQKWQKGTAYTVPNMADDYHVYAVGWDSSGIKFYFDGELKNTIPFPLTEDGDYSPHFYNNVPLVLIINLAVGGQFLGSGVVPDFSAFIGPAEDRSLMVDWVRVYE